MRQARVAYEYEGVQLFQNGHARELETCMLRYSCTSSEIQIRVGNRFADSACMMIKYSKQMSAVTILVPYITDRISHEGLPIKLLAFECVMFRL